jgi:hypothetical protein
MRHLITAVICGPIFYWLQLEFRKIGKGTKEEDARHAMRVGAGILVMAMLFFILPVLIGNLNE